MAQSPPAASGTASEYAESEMPASVMGEGATFPPYPPYNTEPAPPSVANTIIAGRDIRIQHKSIPRQPVRPAPKPAKPRGPKATDVKLNRRSTRAHARCLRRHGAILTDRLERISKPCRRNIINLWREHAYTLPPETIAVWIDDVLAESEDRMLMMDFDEDDEVEKSAAEVDRPPSATDTGASSTPRGSATGSTPTVEATPTDTPGATPGVTPGATPGRTPQQTPTTTPAQTPRQSKSDIAKQ
ncbi:unnamed protein product [Diatraea saccharalis]|uniref:Uncharacterized protein n=1 Tax=Diatraea saccharalis TaxID=40085 RepID=A0A9N9RHH0_9NEOP|nr:unnamed protein product [Diatraea saccharalis]